MTTGLLTLAGVVLGALIVQACAPRITQAELDLLLPHPMFTTPPTTTELNTPGDLMPTPFRPFPLTCTETALVVYVTLPELARHPRVLPQIRDRIEEWLAWHGLDIRDVAIGHAITRDPEQRTLRWTGVSESRAMCEPVSPLAEKVQRQPPPRALGDAVVWPAPFPPEVLKASEHLSGEGTLR